MTSLVDAFVAHLSDPSMDIRSKLNVATEMRDSVEINQVTADQEHFASQLLPKIMHLLDTVPISMVAASPEHKLRHLLLDVLARLQPGEMLKPHAKPIMELVMRIAQNDNEENGVLCMKVLTNLHRAFKQELGDYVQPFLDYVVLVIGNMPKMVHDLFDAPESNETSNATNAGGSSGVNAISGESVSSPSSTNPNHTPGETATPHAGTPGSTSAQAQLFPATHSFKVLTECPIIIVLLFTSHRQVTQKCLPTLVPHAIEVLNLEAAPQAREHAAAASRGTFFAGVAPSLRQGAHRHAYGDFVTTQVKMMSFVSFIVRAFSPVIQRHLPMVPNFMIRLLKDCPPENSAARKELLVAMRHITNTEHRAFFLNKVHILLEERVLIGSGLTAYETLRPIAFSTVADLIHHLRNELSIDQIWQAVTVYTKNLLDMNFAPHYQGMCLKLLINVLDRLSSMQAPQEGRQIMMLVLKAILDRVVLVNRQKLEVEQVVGRTDKIIKIHQDAPNTELKDAKFVFRGLVMFLRSLMYCLKASNPPPNQQVAQWGEAARVFDTNGVSLFRQLLRETTKGLSLYENDKNAAKENMDAIVTVYMQLDPATFNEIFGLEIGGLVDWVLENPDHLHMTYLLTGNEATSLGFSTILLRLLMTRLREVGEPKHGALLLRLFKQCFSSINMFPTTNESVILPHLDNLIVKSLDYANDATDPKRFYALLQHLFRTLGGGRFDSVYKLVLPLLYYLLETLNQRLVVARTTEERNIHAELCLTVPVRLSLMVPHLNFLMRPLATALNAVDTNLELVAQGLRTLELCVDNLTAAYFDPHIEPVLPEILPALWRLLQPLPFDHKLSHTTLRILGKLGGRSRAHIRPPNDLRSVSALDQDSCALLTMDKGDVVLPLRVTPAVTVALRVLESPSMFDPEYHMHAFKVLSAVMLKFIPQDTTDLSVEIVDSNVRASLANANDDPPVMKDFVNAPVDRVQTRLSAELVEQLLKGLFLCCQTDLKEQAQSLIRHVVEHLVLLELAEFNTERHRALRPLRLEDEEGPQYVPARTLVSATVLALSHENSEVSDTAANALRYIHECGALLCGPDSETFRRPMFRVMFAKISHACFDEPWYVKRGALRGLDVLIREMDPPKSWLKVRAVELARTLFFVIKDSSPVGGYGSGNVPTVVSKSAADLLMHILHNITFDKQEKQFTTFVGLLAFELESACSYSREVAQRSLRYVAEATNQTLSELLSQVTDVFLRPIFVKPLRALPFPMQIGYSDCISFCLSLPNTFLKFNDKLLRLLEEALALVDADDESLTSGQRLCEYTTAQQLTELRVVCIRLLAHAITTSEYLTSKVPGLRARIIALYFKIMGTNNLAAVDAAYNGMKLILDMFKKLPKDLLQAGLKPILLPLSDFKRLNVNVLNCLARMLELLTYNFKVEIGVKLLDHLRTLADPARLANLSVRVLEGEERVELGAAFINVFHALPPTAHIFIPQLLPVVIDMETQLRRSQSTPLREPTAIFLNRYPTEAFEYFAAGLTNPTMGPFFADMVARSPALAAHTQAHIESLCSNIMTQPSEEEQCFGICHLVQIVKHIQAPTQVLFNLISSIGDVVRATSSQPQTSPLHLAVPVAIADLQLVIIERLQTDAHIYEGKPEAELDENEKPTGNEKADKSIQDDDDIMEDDKANDVSKDEKMEDAGDSNESEKDNVTKEPSVMVVKEELSEEQRAELLETLVYALCDADLRVVPQIRDYFWHCILNKESEQFWLTRALQNATKTDAHPRSKELFMTLINIILLVHSESKTLEHVVEQNNWLSLVNELVWQRADQLMPEEGSTGNSRGCGLGISTLDYYFVQLLQMSVLLVQHAPTRIVDMRKSVIKFGWRYITVEDSVSKLCAYVLVCYFVAAFDTLPKIVVQIYMALLKTAQVDVRSLVQQALNALATVIVQRINSPMWARAPRRILSEDGHGILGVTNVCLFLAQHAQLFYPYRDLYVPYVVSALARLSYMNSQALDVELAELLAAWEVQRASEDKGYEVPHPMREAVITYLVRFITTQPLKARDQSASTRVLKSLDTLLGAWPDTEVRLNFFDRILAQSDLGASPPALSASLDALHMVDLALKHRSREQISEQLEQLGELLTRALQSTLTPIHNALTPILERLLACDVDEFVLRLVVGTCGEHLAAVPPHHVWVKLAKVAVKTKPNCLDEHMALVMKGLSRMARDLLEKTSKPPGQAALSSGAGAGGAAATPAPTSDVDSSLLVEALELVADRISHLGDQRRPFLSCVAHVIERIHDPLVAHCILDMTRSWVFGSEPFPTVKEKSAILYKLLVYTDRELVEKYYQIIIDVFESPRLRNTELPTRLEQPFLVGCTSSIVSVRNRLLQILTDSVERNVLSRMHYVIAEQSWESIADRPWLCQALQLVLSTLKQSPLKIDKFVGFAPISVLTYTQRDEDMQVDPDQNLMDFVSRRREFLDSISVPTSDFVQGALSLMFIDNNLVHETWRDVFPSVYRAFADKDRHELIKHLVGLMAKEYHLRQADARPNVIQTLLAGIADAKEQIPPQLAKYLSMNFDSWYSAIEICENIMQDPQSSSPKVAEVNLDSLTELYAALAEDDHFYGLWRTRSKFPITSAALSYEQCGVWGRAMHLHETAQVRARSGVIPFSDSEYALWEDHWIFCAEKLQHWEILTDIAKHEGFTDLLLECQWRLADWTTDREALGTTIRTVMDVPTPRRQVFETFLSLQGFAQKADTLQHLSQTCDEGIQLALRKWHGLPKRFTPAHAPLLHIFQQYVEFMEATQVYTSLQATTALNLEAKSQELKGVMQAWHDRLPNVWDDINWWGDLAAWRQQVFGVINRSYLPLIPQLQAAQPGGATNSSAAYRGYHEIAWTINRFAHTARKQNMPEVCTSQLTKIYTLPNIEIQEAFLKLREQAKCHLQNPDELVTGLDVISNTNLAFFGNPQKAEFFALKGESLAKLGQNEHAYNVLSAAVQVDLHLPKAWAAWGEFNDRRFKENPEDWNSGSSAITCYLHAIGLYKNRKSRKLIGRLLWLIGLPDPTGQLGDAYEDFRGETPTWYFVMYIPQLLTSLTEREGKYTSRILVKIARAFPQALHFHLRTARDEYLLAARIKQRAQKAKPDEKDVSKKTENQDSAENQKSPKEKNNTEGNTPNKTVTSGLPDGASDQSGVPGSGTPVSGTPGSNRIGDERKTAIEYTEIIMNVLKTAHPLLALSLETLIDQIGQRFKTTTDEDVYRVLLALLNDGVSLRDRQMQNREQQRISPQTEQAIERFAETMPEALRTHFKSDFINDKPDLETYVQRLRKWRNRFEKRLDVRPQRVNMEAVSPALSEFQYQKFEDVEIPGQNMELVDDNRFFTKIARFLPQVEHVRGYNGCVRRITIQATDGSLHTFAVQYPSARHGRREERMSQVFKILDSVMQRRTETRRRGLTFTLPNAVPLSMQFRLVADDPNYINFYSIYERFCRERNQSRDLPFDYTFEQLQAALDPTLPKPEMQSIKVEILADIQEKFVPQTIMRDFFLQQFRTYEDFWLFRKQFAYQYAGVAFMTVMMSVNNRFPQKFVVDMRSGNVVSTEMQPIVMQTAHQPSYLNGEPVAFRLTPNLQTLMGSAVIEGLLAPTMMVIGCGLSDPEFDLQQFLPLFVRDDIVSFFCHSLNPAQKIPENLATDQGMLQAIKMNVEAIGRRAASLGQQGHPNSAADQTALDLISLAVNPRSLATTEMLWMPYF